MIRIPVVLVCTALLLGTHIDAGEIELDAHTLFLSHFNTSVHEADYALGLSLFAGNGAKLVDGYYGKAVDLRRRGLHPDFMSTCEDYTPRYDGWGFHPRGNVDLAQGTFECWFRVAAQGTPRMPWGANFLHGSLARSVKHPERPRYASFGISLDYYRLVYTLPTLAKNCFTGQVVFKQVEGFAKPLDPADWHHFALCWSQGEMVMWLDGRPLATFDMAGQLGLVIMSNPVRYLNMADCIVDELRISNVVRYGDAFEPPWRERQRPEYAFPGVPRLKRHDPRLLPSVVPQAVPAPDAAELVTAEVGDFALRFSKSDGRLIGFHMGGAAAKPSANGLMLYQGLGREPLKPNAMRKYRVRDGRLSFVQSFEGEVVAYHKIAQAASGLSWQVQLENCGEAEIWLEPLLSIPLPLAEVDELYDGCQPRRVIHLPRHRDEYKSTLPFSAASGGRRFVGLGIDPHIDLKRVGYAGSFWGHGPGADKGDEYGSTRWWSNPAYDDDKHYKGYTRRLQRMWGSVYDLRQYITLYHRQSFENFYPVRRFHACPDMTPEYIIEDLWPGHEPNEDPLCFGQYYQPIWQALLINEYRTPIGAHFCDNTRKYIHQQMGYSPGYINDMSHAGSLYRHNDPIAQRTPGRSFSRDLGTFVRKALGRKQRYEVVNSFMDRGHRLTMWSDGGAFSHTLCAYSSAIAIEGAGMYKDLVGPAEYVVPARFMLGEKPITAMTHLNDDWIGRYLDAEEFTPESLRAYYRFCERQLVLFCVEHGITLDPTSYMWGRQFSFEAAPIMVESTVLGRQVVPAARVAEPLWVRRAGRGLDTFLVAGNSSPRAIETDIEVVNRYFSGAPVFAPYYGGEAVHRVSAGASIVRDVTVQPRDLAAFKAAAMLGTKGDAEATTRLSGDGIAMRLELQVDAPAGGELLLSTFGPLYEVREVRVGEQAVRHRIDDPLILDRGRTRVRVTYQNRSLRFSAGDWEEVELIKDGQTNFCLVAHGGVQYVVNPRTEKQFMLGFERGTAAMLNDFIEQYDSEDGVVGNLDPAQFVNKKPDGYAGWTVLLREDHLTRPGAVTIDGSSREIRIVGATQGEIRRAMVVLMRLVDRKYPHVGRFFPLRFGKAPYKADQPVPIDRWVPRKQTQDFFKKIDDPLFLAEPILRKEYNSLYANSNMDFAGKYRLRLSPYIFEPTYGDDFVYGYCGPGTADTKEALQRWAGTEEPR